MSNYFYKNLYEILEIEPTEDSSKIKAAFRKLARKYHPDLNNGNHSSEEKFKEISQACEVLMDKDKKALYDAFKGYKFAKKTVSPDPLKAKQAYQKANEPPHKNNNAQNSTTNSFSDILSNVMDDLFKSQNFSYGKKSSAYKKKHHKEKSCKRFWY